MKKLFTFVSKVHAWWVGQSTLPFILSANLIAFVLGIPLVLLLFNLDEESIGGPELEKLGAWGTFLTVVVAAKATEAAIAAIATDAAMIPADRARTRWNLVISLS